ncbi:MAG: thiol:disulfide interchange protein DsbA/DsbL [Gammaproteobacteria bacterium]|nr:thiol:disulfide interchange protein DsbA/DsbL [Gammaproteobacteria bacterium]
MNFRHALSLIVLSFALLLNACGDPQQADPAATADVAETAADDAAAEAADSAADAVADETAVDEDVIEDVVEETTADSDDTVDAETIKLGAAEDEAVDWKYSEGEHFRRLTTSQGTSSAPDKIEVAEIFWYGCNHCYNFEPIIEQWKAANPADVSFVQIPVVWNPDNQIHARLMYTAEALGVKEEAHQAAFEEIHRKGNTLLKDDAIIKFFADLGVSEEDFREAYGSFGVTSALKRAENLTRRYGIRSVPILVVNGKYVVEGDGIKSFDDLLNVTNELVVRERTDR